MRKLIILSLIFHFCFGGSPKYGDAQIVIILKEYFESMRNAPTLLGHRFYIDKNYQVIQIEIETPEIGFNDGILFGFNAMSKIADVAKTKFTQSILIIHFQGQQIPVVAKSKLECSKAFFLDGLQDETQWRKNCLKITDT